MSRIPCLLILAGVSATAAFADEVKLERKYIPETKATTNVEANTKQILTIAGMDLETVSSRFVIATSQSGPRDAEGTLPIITTIDKLQLDVSAPGGIKIVFDSGDPDKKADNALLEPILDVLRVAARTRTKMLIDGENRIKSIEFPDNPAEKVGEDYRSQFDPEKRKKAAESERGTLPDKPVKPGDSWTHTADTDIGGGQTLTLETRYEYAGTEQKEGKTLDKITLKTTGATYAMDPSAKSPLKIKSSDLKVASSEGTILFDRDKGAIVESASKLRITGEMKTEINGMELPAKLDLTLDIKTALQP
jgi:hypothetical protein